MCVNDVSTISKFSDITPWLKRFLLRVHPDVVQSHGKEVSDLNQASLQECLRLFDSVKAACTENETNKQYLKREV